MLRYLKSLEDKDVALNRSMIPLGSCTMKLNATAEMIPVTFPGFGAIHPFAPVDQAEGYLEMIRRLASWLATITGFIGFLGVSTMPGLLLSDWFDSAVGAAHGLEGHQAMMDAMCSASPMRGSWRNAGPGPNRPSDRALHHSWRRLRLCSPCFRSGLPCSCITRPS